MRRQHEFFRVGRLIPDDQVIISVDPGTPVRTALELMTQYDFDQVPVMAAGRVIGVFSHRSLALGLSLMRKQDDPLDAPVDDLVEDLPYVRASDEVNAVLANLEAHGVVLVGDEANLIAVATASDVNNFLWNAARPFVLLQDVELAMRDLMRSCATESQLAEAVAAASTPDRPDPTHRLEDLTMGELLSVLTNGRSYGRLFAAGFGPRREIVLSLLDPVREIRNKVFHFRDDVTTEELETLVAAVTWLRRKILIRGNLNA